MTAKDKHDKKNTEGKEESLTAQPATAANETGSQAESIDLIEKLESELQAARLEAVEAREDMLRMQADMENLRKRLVREHEKSRLRTLERFMGDWYVIANIPTPLEKGAHNAVESYRLDSNGTVATTFTFLDV